MATSVEKSESGAPIMRHSETTKDTSLSPTDIELMKKVEDHIEKYVGPIHRVYHEIVSELVHLDVYWIKPSMQLNFNVLVTGGISCRPMKIPNEMKGNEYIELAILLPADWPLQKEDFNKEENYWPVRLLKDVGRLPHTYDTWLGYGHTVENGDPPEPYASNVKFISTILLPSITLGEKFFTLKCDSTKEVRFYCLVPIFKDELDLKMKKGADALTDMFDKNHISDVLNVNRISACTRKKIL